MLNETRELYIESADLIPGWKEIPDLELANSHLELVAKNNPCSDSYLSALVCKYWYLIPHNYKKDAKKYASPEDCYEWLIESIMYVLDKQAWKDPDNSLYQDPNAVSKAIIVCFASARSNFYKAIKRDKRILNSTKLSFNQLPKYEEETEEECLDRLFGPDSSSFDFNDKLFREFIGGKIHEIFKKKEYFSAFALDAIINGNIFAEKPKQENFSIDIEKKRFRQHFHTLDEKFCRWFAKEYSLELHEVLKSLQYVQGLTIERFNRNLQLLYSNILQDKDFRDFLDLDKKEE